MTTQHPILIDLLGYLDANQLEAHSERSAILEFEAGLDRQLAEALALLDLIRINPMAMSGIAVLQVELDGATEWVLSIDLAFARRHLVDIHAREIAVVDLADVLTQQYGGLACLTILG